MWRIGRQFTLGFKRLRKNTGASIRFVLVAERHKSGAPHFHALIHEAVGSPPVRYADLYRDLWSLGFSKYKLAEKGHASYVTKYLTKSSEARVRASLRYGQTVSTITPQKRSWMGCENSTPPF